MKVVVEDANVLLDLVNGGILATWLGCDYENCTTHLVWNEVTDTGQRSNVQPFIDSGLISLRDVPADAWETVATFAHSTGISISDSSVWWVSRTDRAILLTGDSKLRRVARDVGVEVRGVLWVLDELIRFEKITPAAAASALEEMIKQGAFLPPAECEARLRKWRESL